MPLLELGYWQTTYWPSRYWQQDYWSEYGPGAPPPLPTNLLKPGYWPSTFWPSCYWVQDYWVEYGTAIPPTITEGDRWLTRPMPRPTFPVYLLSLIRDYLEVEQDG